MFYIFLILCSISFLLIYKLYFKVDLFIILGYLFIIIISIILYYYLNILVVLFYYFIFSFLYLSFVLDLKEYWIADLTIISVMFSYSNNYGYLGHKMNPQMQSNIYFVCVHFC